MKKIIAIIIALTPFNFLRILLYRLFFKYKISYKSRINAFNILLCKELIIEENAGFKGYGNIVKNVNRMIIEKNATIKQFNKFRDINQCIIGSEAIIVSSNIFSGTANKHTPFKQYEKILVGKKSIITNNHIFDVTDSITIGEDVTFGGDGSQVWTHGADLFHTIKQSPVNIGSHCYIGSRVSILPDVNICNYVSIGTGTVVSKSIIESGFYVSSGLIKKSNFPDFRSDIDIINSNNFFFLRK